MSIKPIETLFDGHRFRSRLEARWAVFFHEVGIRYEYEMEGYQLGDGVRYLPDFYLPDIQIHVEVKPSREISDAEIEKLVRFSVDGGKNLLLIVGTPCAEVMLCLNKTYLPPWTTFLAERKRAIAGGEKYSLQDHFFSELTPLAEVQVAVTTRGPCTLVYKTTPSPAVGRWQYALERARQARFEHGRSGS